MKRLRNALFAISLFAEIASFALPPFLPAWLRENAKDVAEAVAVVVLLAALWFQIEHIDSNLDRTKLVHGVLGHLNVTKEATQLFEKLGNLIAIHKAAPEGLPLKPMCN